MSLVTADTLQKEIFKNQVLACASDVNYKAFGMGIVSISCKSTQADGDSTCGLGGNV